MARYAGFMATAQAPKVHCLFDKMIPLAELKPHPKNRNRHSDEQVARLAKILAFQGWRYPIKVSKRSGFITSGHGRLEAARLNGWKNAPINIQEYTSEEQEYADVQSDNAIASWAELDLSGINSDIGDLGPDFDLELLGIKDFVLEPAELIPQCDEDDVPEKVEPRTKLGDVYQLGRHRLMCGDSTSIDAVEKLMGGEKAEICFTSPPYNLGNNAKLRGHNGDGEDSAYTEKSDHKTQEEYLDFLTQWTSNVLTVAQYCFNNIQLLAGNKTIVPEYWHRFKNNVVDVMVWDKGHAQPSAAARVLNSVWEFIFILTNEENPKRSIKTGPGFRGTIENIYRLSPQGKKDPLAKDHRAVFPVQFAEHFIETFSSGSVLDVFGGSGTTLIAAEKLGRKSFSMELSPAYCDVIVARWEKFTGQRASLVVEDSAESA